MFAAVPGAVERRARYDGAAARQRVVAYRLFRPTHGGDVVTRWASCAVTDTLTVRLRAPATATVPTCAGCTRHHHASLYYDIACHDSAHELTQLADDYPLSVTAVQWADFSTGPSLPKLTDAIETGHTDKNAEQRRALIELARQLPMVALLVHRVGPRKSSFVLLLRPCVVSHARHALGLAYDVAVREVSMQTRFVLWTTMQPTASTNDETGDMCALLTVSAGYEDGDAGTRIACGVCYAMTTQHLARRGVSVTFRTTRHRLPAGQKVGSVFVAEEASRLRWAACRVRLSYSTQAGVHDGNSDASQQPADSPLARCLRQHEVVLVSDMGCVYVFCLEDTAGVSDNTLAEHDTHNHYYNFTCSSPHYALATKCSSHEVHRHVDAAALAWPALQARPQVWAAVDGTAYSAQYKRALHEADMAQQEAALRLQDRATRSLVAQYDSCGSQRGDRRRSACGVRCVAASHSAHILLLTHASQQQTQLNSSDTTMWLVSACAVCDGVGPVDSVEVRLPCGAVVHDACYVVTESFAGFLLLGKCHDTHAWTESVCPSQPFPHSEAVRDVALWFLPLGSNVCVPLPLVSDYAWKSVAEEALGPATRFSFAVVTPVRDGVGQAGVFVTLYSSEAAHLALTAHLIIASTSHWWAHTLLPRALQCATMQDTIHDVGMSNLVLASRTLRQLVAYALLADLGNATNVTTTHSELAMGDTTARHTVRLMLQEHNMRALGLEYILLSAQDDQQRNMHNRNCGGGAYVLLMDVVALLSDALHESAQGTGDMSDNVEELYGQSDFAVIVACLTALFDGVADVLPTLHAVLPSCDAHGGADLDVLLLRHVPWLHDVFGLLRDAVHSLAMHGCVSAIARCVLPLAVAVKSVYSSRAPNSSSSATCDEVLSCLLGPIFDDAYAACLRHSRLAAALLPHCSAALRDMSSAVCATQDIVKELKRHLTTAASVKAKQKSAAAHTT